MKKYLLTLITACAALGISAQEYLQLDSHWYGDTNIPVEQIDSITYGELSHADKLPAIMAKDPNISIFNEALRLTGMCDSLTGYIDYDYEIQASEDVPSYDEGVRTTIRTTRYRKYTVLAEPDSVFAKYGITNVAQLKDYAAQVYDEVYPEDASVADPTDRRNSLNRFVSYHLLYVYAPSVDELTPLGWLDYAVDRAYEPLTDIADWYETMMPHSLMKCVVPKSTDNHEQRVFVNFKKNVSEGAQVTHPLDRMALNGAYYYVDDIIAYDKRTQEEVLDESLVFNESILTPELMNNDLRIVDGIYQISDICVSYFAAGYEQSMKMKNIRFNNPCNGGGLYTCHGFMWGNFQTDEMLIKGVFDVTIKLPPVPAGTYELNFGYSQTSLRPVVNFYLDGELCDSVDLRIPSSDPRIDWIADENAESPAATDQILFKNGYRKGLSYVTDGGPRTQRDDNTTLRRIITTFTTDGKTDHYLRIKNVTPEADRPYFRQFMMDFIELCPTHLLPEYQ